MAYIYGEKALSSTVLDLENPKRVVEVLVEGPMTKWELKQKTKMEYSRVHEAVSLLERDGRVKVYDKIISKKGRELKVYGLTFKGAVAYLASLDLMPPTGVYPLEPGETVEDAKKKYIAEKEAYQKQVEKVASFLERYGQKQLLDFALFRQVRWLMERWPLVVEDIVGIAKFIEFFKPIPKGFMLALENEKKKLAMLKREKWEMLRNPQKPGPITVKIQEGETVKEEIFDPLKNIEEEIKILEERIRVMFQQEERLWKRSFTAQFAERYEAYKPKEGKDMQNKELSSLFEKAAEEIRRLEVEPLEKMAELFKA